MSVQTRSKLNQLERALPEGLLVDASWLEGRGYYRSQRSQYVSAGWLNQPARGVFCRLRGVVSWEQVVISLQTLLEFPVSVGGRSALELQGYAHYLPQTPKTIHLYSDKKLPAWVFKLDIEQMFIFHNRLRYLPEVELSPQALSLTEHISDSEALDGALRIERWGNGNGRLLCPCLSELTLNCSTNCHKKKPFIWRMSLWKGWLISVRAVCNRSWKRARVSK